MINENCMMLCGETKEPDSPTPGKKWGGIQIPSTATVAPTGRCYYPHSSGKGLVMCWSDNGVKKQTIVLYWNYVITKKWSGSQVDIGGIANYSSNPFSNSRILSTGSSSTPSDYNVCTDSYLMGRFLWRDSGSSRSNTTAMMGNSACSSTDKCAGYCRSITVNGTGCDLPNFQTLVRIFCDRETISSLDTSSGSSSWKSWSSSYSFSSSECNNTTAWSLHYKGIAEATNKFYNSELTMPVLDLV